MSDGMKIDKSSNVSRSSVEMAGAEGVDIRRLVSRDDGAPNFAMRMFELAPGGHTPLHAHPHEHEVFIVEGEGVFVFEGREHAFAAEHFPANTRAKSALVRRRSRLRNRRSCDITLLTHTGTRAAETTRKRLF